MAISTVGKSIVLLQITCQSLTNAARILVKMAAHASMASTATRAAVKPATPGHAAKQVRVSYHSRRDMFDMCILSPRALFCAIISQ